MADWGYWLCTKCGWSGNSPDPLNAQPDAPRVCPACPYAVLWVENTNPCQCHPADLEPCAQCNAANSTPPDNTGIGHASQTQSKGS